MEIIPTKLLAPNIETFKFGVVESLVYQEAIPVTDNRTGKIFRSGHGGVDVVNFVVRLRWYVDGISMS
jgi:hypothetical protein